MADAALAIIGISSFLYVISGILISITAKSNLKEGHRVLSGLSIPELFSFPFDLFFVDLEVARPGFRGAVYVCRASLLALLGAGFLLWITVVLKFI